MSGLAGRSGHKPDVEMKALRVQLDQALNPTDWQALIRKVFELAMRDNLSAARLLFQYRFGMPSAQADAVAQATLLPGMYLPLRADEPVPDRVGLPPFHPDFPGDEELALWLAEGMRQYHDRQAAAAAAAKAAVEVKTAPDSTTTTRSDEFIHPATDSATPFSSILECVPATRSDEFIRPVAGAPDSSILKTTPAARSDEFISPAAVPISSISKSASAAPFTLPRRSSRDSSAALRPSMHLTPHLARLVTTHALHYFRRF